MKKFLNKIRKALSHDDVVQFKESHYCAVINGSYSWYDTKEAMLNGIEAYSKVNAVFELSMFRYDMFNLLK